MSISYQNLQLSNISRGSNKYVALKPLWDVLNHEGLLYANIKGEALSLQAYRQYGMRAYGDIDLLVRRNDMPIIKKHLFSLGFKEKNENLSRENQILIQAFSHQTKTYVLNYKEQMIHLDINLDVFWGEYEGEHIDIGEFLSDIQEKNIYGIIVKVLPPLKVLVQLVLHHYKDMNSIFLLATRKSIKPKMFDEVYNMIKNNTEVITISALYEMCNRYKIIPYVYYILFYTGMIYKDELLKEYIYAFKTSEGEKLLDYYGLAEKERHKWNCDFYTRLECDNLYYVISKDLSQSDMEKIKINRKVFMNE